MSYELLDESGKAYYAYHSDRDLCDNDECPCTLPSTPQRAAQRRADDRDEWYVIHGGKTGQGTVPLGPYNKHGARRELDRAMASGNRRAKLLRVVEDYGR